ncbi:uncharacterized protein LOC131619176 [Vicia villosa]|uniref:uncharacterized protein LOC131619176 n=1 Tax=Vicia villosa TaxID=3911 RepID=UPI00273BCB72|nr:uncharacterized protein LOC131619176 [Vicia villosa]
MLSRAKDSAWQPPTVGMLNVMWKLSIPPKIPIFSWRLFTARLPLKDFLLSRGVVNITSNPLCVFCGNHPETLIHLFFLCHVSKTMWSRVFLWLGDEKTFSLEEFMDFGTLQIKVKSHNDRRKINTIWIAITWGIWLMRNAIIFEQLPYSFDVVSYNVMFFSWSWLASKEPFSSSSSFFDWYVLPLGCFKAL